VRLFEHPDFEQAILRAAEHFREQGLRPAIIEKDYYVTEALRAIGTTAAVTSTSSNIVNNIIIFKGGTSLSKGWNLVRGFRKTSTSSLIRRPFSRLSRIEPSTENLKNFATVWRRTPQ
jgi:hypothetical protein